jgi:tripartite-type tricarboxylate transporter receptor subunit TctC
MRPSTYRVLLALSVSAAFLAAAPVSAQDKTARFMVSFTTGGTADALARLIAQKLGEVKGVQAVVENRGGAGGTVGLETFKTWPADGSSYSVIANTQVISQLIYPKLSYDMARDFEPVLFLGASPMVIAAQASRISATSLDQVLAQAKASPGKLVYGECAPGSAHHLAMELLKLRSGADIRHIAYKGCSQSVTDALAGQIDLVIASAPALLPHVRSGKLVGIAVTGAKRSPAAPTIAAVAESVAPGLTGFAVDNWYGIIAASGTPRAALAKMEADVRDIMARPEVLDRLAKAGIDVTLAGPAELRGAIVQDLKVFQPIVQAAQLKPN